MHAKHDTGLRKVVHEFAALRAVLGRKDELHTTGAVDHHLAVAIDVAVSMTRDRDRLLPAGDQRLDALRKDRLAEDGAVQNGAKRPVRTFIHRLQIIFFHARRVRRDRRALDADAVFFDRMRRVDRHLIVRPVAIDKP